MPKFSDDALLQQAISRAALDRESLIDADSGIGEWADQARAVILKFEALRGKRLASLTQDEKEIARLCFIFAERWEQSLADARAYAGSKNVLKPQRAARLFREARLRRWGTGCAPVLP